MSNVKKILMYRWKAYNYLDIKKHFELRGYQVDEMYQHLESYDVEDEFSEKLREQIRKNNYDFVFTVNYFAVISNVCKDTGTIYVSWSCDNPLISMYHESVFNDINRIFSFDYLNFHEFKEMGVEHIYYLPLCVDYGRLVDVIDNADDLGLYKNEISFVGSLYERNSYDRIEPEFSEYLRGYMESYIQIQSNMMGESLIDVALTPEVLAMIEEKFTLDKSDGSFSDLGLIFSTTTLGFKVARETRIEALNRLAKNHDVSIYSNSDVSVLPRVKYKGGLDYWSEMPKAFYGSKVNLNFTIPNIKSGIPLRVWDILGSRGFLLTNSQSEMKLFFEEDKDIVTFSSYKEMEEKADYYLKHPKEREEITEKAFEKIKKYHNYNVRIGELLETLKETV